MASSQSKTAVVVGGGLAGATAAYRLAQLGFKVTLLEAEDEVSQQASGNLAGAIHPLVTADWNLRSQFYLEGLQATLRWLKPWWHAGLIKGEHNGLMQLAMSPSMEKRLQSSLRVMPENFAIWQTPKQASERIGVQTDYGGLFFPQGGWVQPKSVVETCISHDNIEVMRQQKVEDIAAFQVNSSKKNDQAWRVSTANHHYDASVVVVATGALDEPFNSQLQLPIRPVKGQVTHLAKDKVKTPLKTTVTHEGYSVSGDFGLGDEVVAISGATFEAPDMTASLSLASQHHNEALAAKAMPNWLTDFDSTEILLGKVGFRPTTPDHLPIFGAVPDWSWVTEAYLQRKHTHAVRFYPNQRYQAGLYVSNGHGARGLMSAFLAADTIANSVAGAPPILSAKLRHAVHPARFLIRQWRKGESVENLENR
ncbi:hypothetical protein CYQ88_01455 [Hydrogenovibrio sp. SC-1]|nr:hypothetical protein CYQ88_01455 [Hydrogenovibrio sp. SC-1]